MRRHLQPSGIFSKIALRAILIWSGTDWRTGWSGASSSRIRLCWVWARENCSWSDCDNWFCVWRSCVWAETIRCFYSAESIGLHSTAVNASSLLLIFSSKACNRSVVTVRLARMTAASRACNGSPIVFWREDWHRLTDTYADEHTPASIYARKKKKIKRAQLGNHVEFLLASTFDFFSDADHLSLGSIDCREDRVGTFREFFETRVRVVQEDPGRRASFVLRRQLSI